MAATVDDENDELMRKFRSLKADIRTRGIPAVAKEMRDRSRAQTIRDLGRRAGLECPHVTDAEIVEWFDSAERMIASGAMTREEGMERFATALAATEDARAAIAAIREG